MNRAQFFLSRTVQYRVSPLNALLHLTLLCWTVFSVKIGDQSSTPLFHLRRANCANRIASSQPSSRMSCPSRNALHTTLQMILSWNLTLSSYTDWRIRVFQVVGCEQLLHPWRDVLDQFFHTSRTSGYLSNFITFLNHKDLRINFLVHHDLRIALANFIIKAVDTWSNSHPIHSVHFSWELRHLVHDSSTTLLWCNDSSVRPSRRTHLTHRSVRRHQHDKLLHKYGPSRLCVFFSLSLGDSLFSCIQSLLLQGSPNDRSDSLSTFVVTWLCHFSMHCMRCASSSVSVNFNLQCQQTLRRSFSNNPWQRAFHSFRVNSDFLRQLEFWSHNMPRSVPQTFPLRRFPCITQCLSSWAG